MDIKNIFNETFNQLEENLDVRSQRHKLIVSNIANMDTPGYKAFDLIVEEEMKSISLNKNEIELTRTNPMHINGKNLERTYQSIHVEKFNHESDNGNTVDMDKEMGKLSENNLLFNVTAQIISKRFNLLKAAIDGGKK